MDGLLGSSVGGDCGKICYYILLQMYIQFLANNLHKPSDCVNVRMLRNQLKSGVPTDI